MTVHQEQLLGTGQSPVTTLLADGGWVTAWQDWTSDDPDSYGIYIRRFDANGDAVGGEQLVNTTTTGDQSSPAIATLSNGDFVVCWSTPSATLGRSQIAYGHDTITDFTATGKDHDVIDLSGLSDDIKSFKDLIAHHVSDHNGDAWIDDGHGDVLVLKHITAEQLAKGDFQL